MILASASFLKTSFQYYALMSFARHSLFPIDQHASDDLSAMRDKSLSKLVIGQVLSCLGFRYSNFEFGIELRRHYGRDGL